MKITNLLICLIPLALSCSRHSGTITGKVVDVSFGGAFIDSCEIVIQKGEGSSAADQSSSVDKSVCDKAETMMGKNVTIKYLTHGMACATETRDIIQSIELVEQ